MRRSIYQEVEELAEKIGAQGYQFNGSLLRFYGLTSRDALQSAVSLFAGILLLVVITGSVMLIYNAFFYLRCGAQPVSRDAGKRGRYKAAKNAAQSILRDFCWESLRSRPGCWPGWAGSASPLP